MLWATIISSRIRETENEVKKKKKTKEHLPACREAVAACSSWIQIVHLWAAADQLAHLRFQLLKSRDKRVMVEMFPGHLPDLCFHH